MLLSLFNFHLSSDSTYKERLARAKEGKDGRPPRFDPVLDEVATKLENEVVELKCQYLVATCMVV